MTQKKEIAILVVLLVIAGNIWYWLYFHEKTAVTVGTVSVSQNYQLLPVENPEIRWYEVEAARRTEYKSNGCNIFSSMGCRPSEPQKAQPKVPVIPEIVGSHQEPVPLPPEIPANMHFFGYGTVPNGTARRAFFTDGEDVYIVSEGEVLLNRFRILKVNNASLDFEEVTSGRRGTKVLEDQGATPSV